ncbi:hypothetical protein [Methanoculleus sp.]|uniref:DUF7557 family protein n=1 Tax=Methanoculleus sp. TaxID=90427 RepID=UPI00320C2863
MSEMTSIKISTDVKDRLNHLKIHPRETYSDLLFRLASQAQTEQPSWHIPLIYVRIRGVIRELRHPIEISIEMDEGEYIMYNHEYRLLVVASDLSLGLKDIIDEFEENWNDFVLQDENTLLGGALVLREELLSLVSGET